VFLELRWGWVFLDRTQILSGIQFTTHSIESFVVETQRFVSSSVNVILTRQTCGQRLSKAAESKRRALGNYFFERICYMFPIPKCRGYWGLSLCTTSGLAFGEPQRNGKIRFFLRRNMFFSRSRHCAAVLQTQVPKLCTDLDLGLLYILILGTCSKFARKNNFQALGVCFLSATLLERWPQVCRVKITFTELLTDRCVSTTKISMLYVVNWIPLRIRIRSRNTQPHLKGGPEPLEKEIHEILGSKREDRFSILLLNWYKIRVSFVFRTCFVAVIRVRARGHCESSRRSARR